jgi:hypothetical protein
MHASAADEASEARSEPQASEVDEGQASEVPRCYGWRSHDDDLPVLGG